MSTLHVFDKPRHPRSPMLSSRAELETTMERTLAQLADVDRQYENERDVIEGALHPRPWKEWRLEQLEQRHQAERQPLVQFLCLLQQQLVSRDMKVAKIGGCTSFA